MGGDLSGAPNGVAPTFIVHDLVHARAALAAAGIETPVEPMPSSELDRPAVRIAVNQGGHLERVARARFPRATIAAIPDNAVVREALRAGKADAAGAAHDAGQGVDVSDAQGAIAEGQRTFDKFLGVGSAAQETEIAQTVQFGVVWQRRFLHRHTIL